MASQGKSRRSGGAANQRAGKAVPARQRHRARLSVDPEQSTRLMLIGAVVGIVALAAGIIGFGYWYSVIRPRHRTVLQVGDIKVSYTAMKRRMAYELLQNPTYQRAPSSALAPAVLLTLTDELIVTERAQSDLGITVTDAEFNAKLASFLGVSANADSKTFADALKRELASSGLTDSELRRMVRAQLLTQKIKDKFTSQVPATAMQAKVDVIETATQADAQKAADRVKAGEDWATVAKAVSTEQGAATSGGIHDYAPQGTFDPAYDATAFSAKIGEVSAPIPAADGQYFVIRVEDRAEKPVTDAQKPQLASKAFQDWLSKQQGELAVKQDFNQSSQDTATADVVNEVIPKLRAQQQQQQAQSTAVAQLTASAKSAPAAQSTAVAQSTPASPSTPVASGSPAPTVPAPGGGNGR